MLMSYAQARSGVRPAGFGALAFGALLAVYFGALIKLGGRIAVKLLPAKHGTRRSSHV